MATVQWSTVVPNTAREDRGDIRRHFNPLKHPVIGFEGCQTLYEAFRHGHAINPLGACFGVRAVSTNGKATPYIYSSYTEVLARINAVAAGFDMLDLVLPTEDNMVLIGLYMKNCMEWVIAEQAIFCLSGATVPFYDTLGPDSVEFILNHTGTKTVVCSRAELERLCQIKKDCPQFECAVLIDGETAEAKKMAKEANVNIVSFAQVEAIGAQRIAAKGHKHRPPSGKDVFTFCYTSGTTGTPKGALLTHENMISRAGAALIPHQSSDRHISYLPLAHIYERVIMFQAYIGGASISFSRGSPLLLIEDFRACRPTILPAPPRVLNKIYDKIHGGIAQTGGMKKKLFDTAVATKTRNLLATGQLHHALYDRLIFNKIKKGLGYEQLRLVSTGSAPLSPKVLNFYRVLLGIPVIEGYGQTETTATTTLGNVNDMTTAGHVGGPSSCVEVVLVDVPEMGYRHTDRDHKGQSCQGRGEIWARGPVVFKGYYKDEEMTKETIDPEGWLKSGDIGLWTMQGALQIIDRKKNIFKLSQGEYVAPEKIENVLIQSLYIAQAFVHGDSLQSALVAIIIPDEDPIRHRLSKEDPDLAESPFATLCQSPKLQPLLMQEIRRVAKENGLHGFEIPKAIHVHHELLSVDNAILTPTFKLKRQQASDKFENDIEAMYASMAPQVSKL